MEQRVSVITLGVSDLPASRRFYVEGLRWAPVMEVEGEVVFFNVGPGLVVGLYSGLAADAGVQGRGAGLTSISQNVASLPLAFSHAARSCSGLTCSDTRRPRS